jgi:hypothetical protein
MRLEDGLDFCHLQDPQIGLPLVELTERITVGAEVLWQPALTSKGALNMRKSPTPSTVPAWKPKSMIHNHQDPVGPQGYRLTAEQIHTPEAFFHVAEESQPGRPAWTLSQPVVMGENPCGRAKVIGSAIRGRPQRGLRFFISTIEPR